MNTPTEMRREFEQYAEIGNEFIERLGIALNTKRSPRKTLRILNRVFAGLRSHLPFHESVSTIEILPMAIRGVYVDGWGLRSSSPKITTTDDFLMAVMGGERGKAKEFHHVEDAIIAALGVIETIAQFAFPGMPDDTIESLPRGLRNLYHTLTRISSRNTYSRTFIGRM